MDPKTILVHVPPTRGDAGHVQVAAGLADLFDAELIGVSAECFRADTDPRLSHLDGLQIAAAHERIRASMEAARAQFLACTPKIRRSWRDAFEDPDDLLVRWSARADLIVAAADHQEKNWRTRAETDDLILDSGLPVLVVPAGRSSFQPRSIIVGWTNAPEARRAIGDALPFLKRAQGVHVVAAAERRQIDDVKAELEDVMARLAAHGIQAQAEPVATSIAPAAEVLLQMAGAHRADLLVVGAYGRSRMRQRILGGVTAHLLRHSDRPVLFSR